MIALVTGASGFLGRVLVARLLAAGGFEQVRCLVRSEPAADALNESLRGSGLRTADLAVGSFSDAAFLDGALRDVGVLFHLAASARGAPADIFHGTVVGSQRLMEALRRLDSRPRTVLVSSLGVYGTAQLPQGATIDEDTPLEPHPARRDPYSHAKIRQEQLVVEFARVHGLPLTIVRPAIIYGPGGNALPTRLGLKLPGLFLLLGGGTRLPLTFVKNCAEAVHLAGTRDEAIGQRYNVIDDDLPTCRQYLRLYRKHAHRLRSLGVPYPITLALAHAVEWYHRHSRGQLPAFLTPYRAASLWKGWQFDNRRLKSLGWQPGVTVEEGLKITFEAERHRLGAT